MILKENYMNDNSGFIYGNISTLRFYESDVKNIESYQTRGDRSRRQVFNSLAVNGRQLLCTLCSTDNVLGETYTRHRR